MIKVEKVDEGSIVRPEGSIVSTRAEKFRDELKKLIDKGEKNIIIDLADVDLIDSRGLSVFILIHQTLATQGGRLTVVTDNKDIRNLFTILRLDKHFVVCSSEELTVKQ